MHHVDPKDATRLDDTWRREALPPLPTLLRLGFQDTDAMLDFGCGIGYFTFPAAVTVGPSRKVFALDASEAMLDEMDRRVHRMGASNVIPLLSDGTDWKVPDASITFVLCSCILHEVADLPGFLREAKRVLAPGGRIGVVEWTKGFLGRGPSLEERLDPAEVAALLDASGFRTEAPFAISEAYYGLVGVLPGGATEKPPVP
jgi:ubiquinone/menaquinone biosynthesis C-methylase UbiE